MRSAVSANNRAISRFSMLRFSHSARQGTGHPPSTIDVFLQTLVSASPKSCYRSVAQMEGKMPGTVKEALAPAKMELYQRRIRSKRPDVRHVRSARPGAGCVPGPEERLGLGDWCQKSHDEWLLVNQNRLEPAQLRELEAALRRLDRGTFGI